MKPNSLEIKPLHKFIPETLNFLLNLLKAAEIIWDFTQ